jgi:hypothetical protein
LSLAQRLARGVELPARSDASPANPYTHVLADETELDYEALVDW